MIVGGVIAAIVAVGVTLFVGSKLLGSVGGPSEVSEREYVTKLCDVVEPSMEKFEDIADTYSEVDVYGSDFDSSDDAEEARSFMREQLDAVKDFRSKLTSFNDGTVLEGRDGSEVQEDFADILDEWKAELDDASTELSQLDADEMTPDDLGSIDFGGERTIEVDPDVYSDLVSAAGKEGSDCGGYVGSLFSAS